MGESGRWSVPQSSRRPHPSRKREGQSFRTPSLTLPVRTHRNGFCRAQRQRQRGALHRCITRRFRVDPADEIGFGSVVYPRAVREASREEVMTVRLVAVVAVLAGGATARADLPPGAVLRLAADRLWAGSNGFASVAFTPDGRHILTCGTPAGVDVWDATTGRPVRRLPGVGGYLLVVSPDGRWLAG